VCVCRLKTDGDDFLGLRNEIAVRTAQSVMCGTRYICCRFESDFFLSIGRPSVRSTVMREFHRYTFQTRKIKRVNFSKTDF